MRAVIFLQPQMTFCDYFGFSNIEEQKSVSGQQTHKLVFLSLEAIFGKKKQNKKIQGIFYRGNIPQNSHKTVGKNKMGCLP